MLEIIAKKSARKRNLTIFFLLAIGIAVAIPFIQSSFCSADERGSSGNYYTIETDPSGTTNSDRNSSLTEFAFERHSLFARRIMKFYFEAPSMPSWSQKFWCDINAADYFLVVFTLALAASTILLWQVTDQTLSHAEKTSERELRAYIAIAERTLEFTENPRQVLCILVIKNFGKTPAFKLQKHWNVWVDDYPIPSSIPQLEDGTATSNYIAPSDQMRARRQKTFPKSDWNEFISDRKAVWASGTVEYVDAFDHIRRVRFRYFMRSPKLEDDLKKMSIASQGNDAD